MSLHSLKVETGRWPCIVHDVRLYGCGGGVEGESHVLLVSLKTEAVLRKFNVDVDVTVMNNVGALNDCLDVNVLTPF